MTDAAPARLTMLNDMAADDFVNGLDRLREWGVRDLDLRANILGYSIGSLPQDAADEAARYIADRDMSVYSMSTALLVGDIRRGQQTARAEVDAILATALPAAEILQPAFVRILGGQWPGRPDKPNGAEAVIDAYPWVVDEYRRAAELIAEAGWTPILENEATDCFLAHPQELVEFVEAVNVDPLRVTWDVENQWATGTFPTLEHLEMLAPYMSFYHVKGAKSGADPLVPEWNVALEDSTWPVVELTQAVVDRHLSPIICLNPTQHGQDLPGYDYASVPQRDLGFLRAKVRGIE